ncbi:MAG: glycosyltransferase family 4 protein [bacterium]
MIIAYFPPVVGGTEIQTLRLAKALITRNVSPIVITRRIRGIRRFEQVDGVSVYRLFTLGSGTVASLSFMFSSFLFLIKNRRKYQIIHAHLPSSPAITATVAGRVLRKKVMVKFACSGKTGNIQTSDRTCLGRAKLRFLMKYDDVFVCPSEEVERELINYGFDKERVVEIPNGVDTALFHSVDDLQKGNLRKRFNFPSLPIMVYTGRLESRKRLAILLEAWQRVVKVKESYLLIVGDGSQKDRLINLAKKLKIIESVKFTGRVDSVNEYLQAGVGFVFPSSAEGLSNALLEAMATELAIVATKIGGTEEAIENEKNGILVEPDNVDELANGIITLLSQPEVAHKFGREARRTIEENYSIGIVAQKHLKVYEEMIK